MRLDLALVEAGLARSRTQAARLIAAGRVRVNGRTADKPAQPVTGEDELHLSEPDPWVSRAAHKLLGALADLELHPAGRALDAGVSTGGFTQVLRHLGCAPVYAVDVGHGQLADPVRHDPGVIVHEGLNLRDLQPAHLDHRPVDWVVADVSFISLTLLLEPLFGVLDDRGTALLMVKPQFEVGRAKLGKHGVVTDPEAREAAVDTVCAAAAELGWFEHGRVPSRVPGPAGNVEYFVRLRRESKDTDQPETS
ncbi:TlyA family RNA methyltransferase [Enemella sp. A6]|uniref:TlyA family RNA methyltransferase n=1 Tax=Enemella sp. A6 TaxID=3440152 RepID=UPI003EBBEEF5